MYKDDEFLQLAGIQHFCFCRRQWALIHLEQAWEDNVRTKEGDVLHKNIDDPLFIEKRRDLIISRSVPIRSCVLGLSGICDVVEFKKDGNGAHIHGRDGRYMPCPVEYKVGSPKQNRSDLMQLCAQTMSLEEMFGIEIGFAYIYYARPRKRMAVEINQDLRDDTTLLSEEMHKLFKDGKTPKANRTKACKSCSLYDLCLPELSEKQPVQKYIYEMRETLEKIT
jgi:CRISPR-associated exonuclease Cas4